jgi:hypothetical protein
MNTDIKKVYDATIGAHFTNKDDKFIWNVVLTSSFGSRLRIGYATVDASIHYNYITKAGQEDMKRCMAGYLAPFLQGEATRYWMNCSNQRTVISGLQVDSCFLDMDVDYSPVLGVKNKQLVAALVFLLNERGA